MMKFGPAYSAYQDGAHGITQANVIRDVLLSAEECRPRDGGWMTSRVGRPDDVWRSEHLGAVAPFAEAAIRCVRDRETPARHSGTRRVGVSHRGP